MSTIYIHSHVHTHIRTCFHVRVMRMKGPILYGIVHIYIYEKCRYVCMIPGTWYLRILWG